LEDKLKLKRDEKLKEAEEATRKKIMEEFEVAFEKEEESRKRKRKEEQEEEAAKEAKDKQEASDAKATKDGEVQEEKKKLKSELIQEKIDAANAKMESLTEKKSEMVWLMKQVIKAEMKRKLMDPKKKEAT